MHTDHVLYLDSHGFHEMHYTNWGDPTSRHVVLCVHDLTHNCHNFDFLTQALANECHIVCPNITGRDKSDWLNHKENYNYPQYMTDITTLIARITASPATTDSPAAPTDFLTQRYNSRSIYWIGTSMGGMLGMLLAARPKSPIRKLVINDIEPLIPKASLERITTYIGKDPRFHTFEKLETYVRKISAPFGPLTDAQ